MRAQRIGDRHRSQVSEIAQRSERHAYPVPQHGAIHGRRFVGADGRVVRRQAGRYGRFLAPDSYRPDVPPHRRAGPWASCPRPGMWERLPFAAVTVPTSQVEDMKPTDLPDDAEERRVDKSPVPEISRIALLGVVPLGHPPPRIGAHGLLHVEAQDKRAVRTAAQSPTPGSDAGLRFVEPSWSCGALRFIWDRLRIRLRYQPWRTSK